MTGYLNKFSVSVKKSPIVAIIRGVSVDEVVDVSTAIYEAGISIIEVPLNTPNAFECIDRLSKSLKSQCSVGCGTLTNPMDVPRLVDVGAELAVTPSTQPEVIQCCIQAGLVPMPGFMTPTEAFSAIEAGATFLKMFPASSLGVGHVKALKAVIPRDIELFAVGGVRLAELGAWESAGIAGFGFGSEIFSPGLTPLEVHEKAKLVIESYKSRHAG